MRLLRITQTSYNSLKQLVVKAQNAISAFTAEEYAPFGTDSRPPKGMTAIYGRTQADGDEVVIGYLHKNRLAEIGEHIIFSTDADLARKAWVWLKADGTMELNGNDNFAVKFNELKTEFNTLKSDFNNFVTKYNSHVQIVNVVTTCPAGAGTGTGSAVAPTVTQTPNTSNIDNAKNARIKTNS